MVLGITGASGFIGRYVTEQISRASEHEVLAVVRSSAAVDFFEKKDQAVFQCELKEKEACDELISRVDCLLHLAHSNSPLVKSSDFVASELDNLLPSLNLLESIRASGKEVQFIYASSGGTVYHQVERRPAVETDPCAPRSTYGIQKYTIENYILHYVQAFGLDATILRISNPYGVLLDSGRKQGLVGVALNRMIHNQVIEVYGNPENTRDYLHLDDLVRAFERAIETKHSGEIFNIGSGVGASVREILDKLDQFMGFESRREYVFDAQAECLTDWSVLNNSKAAELLGWSPLITLDDGLKALCQSVKGA